jgi:hypothetical protein
MKAFPNPHRTDELGMTLRDYFAAQALQGLLANPQLQNSILNQDKTEIRWLETCAWAFADGMLKERVK